MCVILRHLYTTDNVANPCLNVVVGAFLLPLLSLGCDCPFVLQRLYSDVHLPVHMELLHSLGARGNRSRKYKKNQTKQLMNGVWTLWMFSYGSCSRCVSVLWTAQGNVLAINSSERTIGRNSGIFWALLQFRSVYHITTAGAFVLSAHIDQNCLWVSSV